MKRIPILFLAGIILFAKPVRAQGVFIGDFPKVPEVKIPKACETVIIDHGSIGSTARFVLQIQGVGLDEAAIRACNDIGTSSLVGILTLIKPPLVGLILNGTPRLQALLEVPSSATEGTVAMVDCIAVGDVVQAVLHTAAWHNGPPAELKLADNSGNAPEDLKKGCAAMGGTSH